jgi:hypothetical protein
MNFLILALFFPQSKHWPGKAHLLVTAIESSERKVIMTFSPQESRLKLVEATIVSGDTFFMDHETSFRADLTAARKSEGLSLRE